MKGVFGGILGIILILFGITTFYLLTIQKPTRGWLVRGDHVIGSSITLYFTDESPLVFVPLKDDLSLFSISQGDPGTGLEIRKPARLHNLLEKTYDNGY